MEFQTQDICRRGQRNVDELAALAVKARPKGIDALLWAIALSRAGHELQRAQHAGHRVRRGSPSRRFSSAKYQPEEIPEQPGGEAGPVTYRFMRPGRTPAE